MYRYQFDPKHALYACALSGGGDRDEDFATHVAQLRTANRQVDGRVLRVVVRLRAGHPVPNAHWRSQVGAMMSEEGFAARLAVISQNPVIRGVLTAVSWIVSGEDVAFKMFASSAQAQEWLQQETDSPVPDLQPILDELTRDDVAAQP